MQAEDQTRLQTTYRIARFTPLFAAIIAPFSTLFDIPALSQPWYEKDGQPLPDFQASLILSGISLCFSVIANALLLIRFSAGDNWWRVATQLSVVLWIIKVTVAIVNLALFGANARNGIGFSYLEGFWCAVVSLCASAFVVFFLVAHWLVVFRAMKRSPDQTKALSSREIRIFGRHFMLQVTLFLSGIGIVALILSRLESWTYFDGIYFTVVTVLTIGFGDLSPTSTAGRIILIPFAVFLIAQLANIIGMIARFFEERTKAMEDDWQRRMERTYHERRDENNPHPDLSEELQFLQSTYRQVEMKQQLREVALSGVVFSTFWLIGAVIFWKIEKWTYGDALYFCSIFLLTIGYGDFAPQTNGGRVFFVVYSLLAVPIMTSFAVQAITSSLSYMSNRRLSSREKEHSTGKGGVLQKQYLANGELKPHSDLVQSAHDKLDAAMNEKHSSKAEHGDEDAGGQESDLQTEEQELADRILNLATKLEGHARRLLVGYLSRSDDETAVEAGTLLKADWNVQRREVLELLGGDADSELDLDGDGKGDFNAGAQDDLQKGVDTGIQTLEEVMEYRECFAGILAAGSRLRGLEGHKRHIFERRRLPSTSM